MKNDNEPDHPYLYAKDDRTRSFRAVHVWDEDGSALVEGVANLLILLDPPIPYKPGVPCNKVFVEEIVRCYDDKTVNIGYSRDNTLVYEVGRTVYSVDSCKSKESVLLKRLYKPGFRGEYSLYRVDCRESYKSIRQKTPDHSVLE
ncbi:MAG: hypothetical protein K6G47_02940 [Clostridia bacterium]|nr:hypothetical protein [Clostridia bacterium]